jgi:hypothetical protein
LKRPPRRKESDREKKRREREREREGEREGGREGGREGEERDWSSSQSRVNLRIIHSSKRYLFSVSKK